MQCLSEAVVPWDLDAETGAMEKQLFTSKSDDQTSSVIAPLERSLFTHYSQVKRGTSLPKTDLFLFCSVLHLLCPTLLPSPLALESLCFWRSAPQRDPSCHIAVTAPGLRSLVHGCCVPDRLSLRCWLIALEVVHIEGAKQTNKQKIKKLVLRLAFVISPLWFWLWISFQACGCLASERDFPIG